MNTQGYFPLGGSAVSAGRATATCYCGAVQLELPVEGEDLYTTAICNCTDCRKITASTFSSIVAVADRSVKFVRGKDNLTKFTMRKTIASGNSMDSHFCKTCGTLMYRCNTESNGILALRIGTVDDFALQATKLKPQMEVFCKDRVPWVSCGPDILQFDGNVTSQGLIDNVEVWKSQIPKV
ncbi:hypothetical protein D6D01_10089 [Aureobasidium pullulans]|uniref:CENP-V/GFA domain-containing protein n=1 Tax=Aureobasidium pullulans TaxID=5580 RepID=A0A4S9JPC7_AURPU|nr:hypothetical protein D6D01_10089 [Aureobasidium pullulans]